MEAKEKKVVENFISQFEYLVDQLENYAGYLNLGPEGEKAKKDAIDILKKKLKKMEKADDKSELKKVIRVNKLLEREGLR